MASSTLVLIAKLPDVYQATTTILLDPQKIPERYVSSTVAADTNDRLTVITQEVLSATRLGRIIDELGLYPELRTSYSHDQLVEFMRRSISIQVKQGSAISTFTITYDSNSPYLAAQVADRLAASFINWSVESREQQALGTQDFLSSQLGAARRNLQEQEQKMKEFKMHHLGETPDQMSANQQSLSRLQGALQSNAEAIYRLNEERLLLTRLPEPVMHTAPADTHLSERGRLELEKLQLQAKLDQLREQQYTDTYPDSRKIRRRLREIVAQLQALPGQDVGGEGEVASTAIRVELIDREMKRLKNEQTRIEGQIAAYEAKVEAAPLREQQITDLARNYEISKQHYQTLLDKSFSADMATDLEQKQKGERFKILDPARVPERPYRPKRRWWMLVSCFLALGISIGSVIVKEVVDPTIKTERELMSLLPKEAQVVGFIPRIEIVADRKHARRLALGTWIACFVLLLSVASILWKIHPYL